VVGPHATEMVAESALAIAMESTIAELTSTIHAHPTLSEAVLEAALNAGGRAIHI
jgi:dihydrolipoamide dehydrogenase